MLFDIGYSVAVTRIEREAIDDRFDESAFHAVIAFQRHHFSGRRRRYKGLGNATKGAESTSFRDAGTLDAFTIRAIVEKWWATLEDSS